MEEEIGLVLIAVMLKEERLDRRRRLKHLRDTSDPFSIEETIFVANFMFPRAICRQLLEQLQPHDTQKSTVPFILRFLSALSFFASGSHQKCVGNSHMVAMSQATVSRVLVNISKLIVEVKGNQVHFPQKYEEQLAIKTGNFGVKGTIGAVDCTHIAIQSPPANDLTIPLALYMNRKGYYSINVEAVCDHNLVFTAVNAKFPGSCHDSVIWATSPVRINMMRNYNPQRDTWLLGDQGYPQEPWLFTPVADPTEENQRKYNKLHVKGRNTIERAFGVLKARFRCLSRHRVLHYSHERAANIINACVILHNILLQCGVAPEIPEDLVADEMEHNDAEYVLSPANRPFEEGEQIRTRYIRTL